MTNSTAATATATGKGVLVGLLVLLAVELYLHNDDFLHRYRSVFAVGRAADKVDYVAKTQPAIIFMGNSRVDNGIVPGVVADTLGLSRGQVFNLGIPGQNTRVLYGVVRELEHRRAFSAPGLQCVMIGLDASLFSRRDELNYSVFLADRWKMAVNGEYRVLLSSLFRLWGFSRNLKGLREPARVRDFFAASVTEREPWGGSVRDNLGYRAKRERLTPAERDAIPEQTPPPALDILARDYFMSAVQRLLVRGIHVGTFFTPLYRRQNEFEHTGPGQDNYSKLLMELQELGVAVFRVADMSGYGADLFSNPGHLNDAGARRYSAELARAMRGWCPAEGVAQ